MLAEYKLAKVAIARDERGALTIRVIGDLIILDAGVKADVVRLVTGAAQLVNHLLIAVLVAQLRAQAK